MKRLAFTALTLAVLLLPALAMADDDCPDGMKLAFQEDFEDGSGRWETTDDTNWELHENGDGKAFGIIGRKSDYNPPHRSPLTIALLKDFEAESFVMTLQIKSILDTGGHRDACLFFNHQDATHFYYVHLGATPDPNSGQIMIVNDAPRTPLTDNKNKTPWDEEWHTVKIVRDAEAGTIAIYFDDMETLHMECSDTTFGMGRLGIGSFDDVNDFDNIKVYVPE